MPVAQDVTPPTDPAETLGPQSLPSAAPRAAWGWGWLVFGLVLLAAVTVALPFDEPWSERLGALAPEWSVPRRVLKLTYWVFSPWIAPLVIVAALVWQRRRWELLAGFVAATGVCVGATHLAKWLIGRARPDADPPLHYGAYHFVPLSGFDSLPSAHMTFAVLVAGLMAVYVPRSRWVLLPLAALAGVARIVQNRHYPSDVLAGAGLTIVLLWLVGRWLGAKHFHRLQWPTRWPGRRTHP
jgi:membrane-associated phospholipid phosphatase